MSRRSTAVRNSAGIAAAVMLLSFAGCRDGVVPTELMQDSNTPRPILVKISATEYAAAEQAIRNDPDAIVIVQIGREIGQRKQQRGVSRAQLVAVKTAGDVNAAGALMGMSRVEMALLDL